MKPTIPAELMKRRNEARAAVKSATAARGALDDVLAALQAAIKAAEEAESAAESVNERVVDEIRHALADFPGAAGDGRGLHPCADVDEDKAGRLLLCMEDGRDLLVEVEP
jgi:hypothetical protein